MNKAISCPKPSIIENIVKLNEIKNTLKSEIF